MLRLTHLGRVDRAPPNFRHFDDVVLNLRVLNIGLHQLLVYLLLFFLLLLLLFSIGLLTTDEDYLSKALVFNCSLCAGGGDSSVVRAPDS